MFAISSEVIKESFDVIFIVILNLQSPALFVNASRKNPG
jgi:hypothetical protein